jgi:hypothetical protein
MRKIGTPAAVFRLTSHWGIAFRAENFHRRCVIVRALTATNKTPSIFRFMCGKLGRAVRSRTHDNDCVSSKSLNRGYLFPPPAVEHRAMLSSLKQGTRGLRNILEFIAHLDLRELFTSATDTDCGLAIQPRAVFFSCRFLFSVSRS